MRIGDIVMMIALMVAVIVGVLIVANLQTAVGNLNLTGTANTTATGVFQNVWTGLTLAGVGIIIVAAVGIISMVISSFRGATP